MTVRNGKRLVIATGVLIVIALGLELWNSLVRGHRLDWEAVFMPLLMTVVLAGAWRRYSQLEALHGPDYVQPVPRQMRLIAIGLAIVAAILVAVLVWMLATR